MQQLYYFLTYPTNWVFLKLQVPKAQIPGFSNKSGMQLLIITNYVSESDAPTSLTNASQGDALASLLPRRGTLSSVITNYELFKISSSTEKSTSALSFALAK